MQEILEKYPGLRFEPPGRYLGSQASRDASSSSGLLSALGGAVERVARGFRRDRGSDKRFFLLYLNQETWLGAAGSKLADQVPRPAREPNVSHTPVTRSTRRITPLQPAVRPCKPSRCALRALRASA